MHCYAHTPIQNVYPTHWNLELMHRATQIRRYLSDRGFVVKGINAKICKKIHQRVFEESHTKRHNVKRRSRTSYLTFSTKLCRIMVRFRLHSHFVQFFFFVNIEHCCVMLQEYTAGQ